MTVAEMNSTSPDEGVTKTASDAMLVDELVSEIYNLKLLARITERVVDRGLYAGAYHPAATTAAAPTGYVVVDKDFRQEHIFLLEDLSARLARLYELACDIEDDELERRRAVTSSISVRSA